MSEGVVLMSFDLDIFSSREKALIVWFFLFMLWAIPQRNIRKSLRAVLKALFQKKIFAVIMAMFVYASLLVYAFYRVHVWDISLLKDTVFWVFGSAFVLLMNVGDASKEDGYFKKLILDNLKLIILLEFIINFYAFNFWIEMIVIPILSLIAVISAVSETKPEFAPAKKLVDSILWLFGVCLIIFTISNICKNCQSLLDMSNLRAVMLPPALTITYVPFLYFFALVMLYETLFVRVDIFLSNRKNLARLVKIETIKTCKADLKKLKHVSSKMIPDVRLLDDIQSVQDYFKQFNRKKDGHIKCC